MGGLLVGVCGNFLGTRMCEGIGLQDEGELGIFDLGELLTKPMVTI